MKRLARLALLAYPKPFRRDFGHQYLRTIEDMTVHGHTSRTRLVLQLLTDTVVTAPTMRWEHLMNTAKIVLLIGAAMATVLAIIIGAPVVAISLFAIFAVLAIASRRHDHPIAVEASRWATRWYAWLLAAVGLFLLGLVVLAIDGDDDLSTAAWATWILSWVAAGVVAVVGVGLGVTRLRSHRRA